MYTPELLRVMHTGQIWRLNHKVNGDREHDVEATSDLEAAHQKVQCTERQDSALDRK